VNVGALWWGQVGPKAAGELLDRARRQPVTYRHVGSTLDPVRWPERRFRERRRDLGVGDAVFAEAVDRLRTWAPQRAIGADLLPAGQLVELDATILVVLRLGPLRVVAPDRVVALMDEPGRFAFAYGTLPGHPELGEESFTVEQLDSGVVRATIRVDARPAATWGRLVAPVLTGLQTAAIRRYLAALTPRE
jgi:uncharacterized protein (UPF0548 family)